MNTAAWTASGPSSWPPALRLTAFAALVSAATFAAVALALPASSWLGVGFTTLATAMALEAAGAAWVCWTALGGRDGTDPDREAIAGLMPAALLLGGLVLTFIAVDTNPLATLAQWSPAFP